MAQKIENTGRRIINFPQFEKDIGQCPKLYFCLLSSKKCLPNFTQKALSPTPYRDPKLQKSLLPFKSKIHSLF